VQFTFLKNGSPTPIYNTYKNLAKVKGKPQIDYVPKEPTIPQSAFLPIEKFNLKYPVESVYKEINQSSKAFFKWLLGV
jgi:hypothetical protein